MYKQSVYTNIGKAGIGTKVDVPEETIHILRESALATGLFRSAGTELKCLVNREYTDGEVEKLIGWIREVVEVVEVVRGGGGKRRESVKACFRAIGYAV